MLVISLAVAAIFSRGQAVANEWKAYKGAAGDYSIECPADWVVDLEAGKSIYAPGGLAFIDILSVPLAQLSSPTQLAVSVPPDTLEGFADLFCRSEINKRVMIKEYAAELLEEGDARLSGYPAKFFLYTTLADKAPRIMHKVKEYALVTPERGYVLKYYAGEDHFYKYLRTAEKIIRSFAAVNLDVKPGASLDSGLNQEIRFLSIAEIRETPKGLWLAGKGYARIDNGSAYYFWQDTQSAQVEVELAVDPESLGKCRAVIKEKLSQGEAFSFKGMGQFQRKDVKDTPVGIFVLNTLSECQKITER